MESHSIQARRLSLAPSTLGYWVKAQRAGKLGDVGIQALD